MAVMLVNNAVSRLAASVAADALALSVSAGDGGKFPSPGVGDWFPLTLIRADGIREIVRCTNRVGDVLTVVRAQEGTGAVPLASGDRVELRLTVAALNTIFGGSTALPTFGSLELKAVTPYVDFHANNSADDYTTRVIAEANASLLVRSAVKDQIRINDAGLSVFGQVGCSGGALFNNTIHKHGTDVVGFNTYRTDSNLYSVYQAQTTSGSIYFGNYDGVAFGIGGTVGLGWATFRDGAASVNGSFSAVGSISAAGNLSCFGNVIASNTIANTSVFSGGGAASMGPDGMITGPAWGGPLGLHLPFFYTQRANIPNDYVTYAGNTGGVGSYALMTNRTGVSLVPGQLVGGGALTYSNTEAQSRNGGSPGGGTWRCMGSVSASQNDQGTTLFLRIA